MKAQEASLYKEWDDCKNKANGNIAELESGKSKILNSKAFEKLKELDRSKAIKLINKMEEYIKQKDEQQLLQKKINQNILERKGR